MVKHETMDSAAMASADRSSTFSPLPESPNRPRYGLNGLPERTDSKFTEFNFASPPRSTILSMATSTSSNTLDKLEATLFPPPNDADVSAQSKARMCRICHGEEEEGERARLSSAERLVAPCGCRGSLTYVHPACLRRWIQQRGGALTCELCGSEFRHRRTARSWVFSLLSSAQSWKEWVHVLYILYVWQRVRQQTGLLFEQLVEHRREQGRIPQLHMPPYRSFKGGLYAKSLVSFLMLVHYSAFLVYDVRSLWTSLSTWRIRHAELEILDREEQRPAARNDGVSLDGAPR